MRSQGDPAAVERELLDYARRARERGLEIVYGAFDEDVIVEDDEAGLVRRRGVCALGAYDATARKDEPLSLPEDSDKACAAWEAIEAGFDGSSPEEHPPSWWQVGANLRAALQPRKARTE